MEHGDEFIMQKTNNRFDGGTFVFDKILSGGVYGWWPDRGRGLDKPSGLFCYAMQAEKYLVPVGKPTDNIPEIW